MFFDNSYELIRVLVVGTLAYAALVLMLRISGKRTLAKMNAFDFVVTIALGSTLATIVLTKDVALVEGLLALALLIALQFVVAWLSVRSQNVRGLVKAEPRLLVFRGELLRDAMRAERYTEDEVHAAVRSSGIGSMSDVEAVVVETDGTVTVIKRGQAEPPSALLSVRGWPADEGSRARR